MTPDDFKREDFEAIMQPLPEIPPLGRSMTVEDYERLAMRLEDRIKDLEAKLVVARAEAFEEAETLAVLLPGVKIKLLKPIEECGPIDYMHAMAEHIASAIREAKGAALTE